MQCLLDLLSEKASAQNSSPTNGDSDGCELDCLQCLYQQLVPTRDSDVAMVTEWGMKELFTIQSEVQNNSIPSTPEIKPSLTLKRRSRMGF